MVKKIKGDLILTKDTTFDESIEVEGNITCEKERYDLKVAGDIDAWNIDVKNIIARNIYTWNIDALNINARDIDAGNIDALNINAWNIDAMDIDARDINARDISAVNIYARDIVAENIYAWSIIFCESIKLKDKKKGKIRAKAVIRKRYELKQREFKSD